MSGRCGWISTGLLRANGSLLRGILAIGIVLRFGVFAIACSGSRRPPGDGTTVESSFANETAPSPVLRIAEQHGIAYAPLALMQVEGMIEAEWYRMANATVIREAMLAGRLDIGSMGIPPYLIGRDRGTDWEIVAGVSEVPVGLVTRRPDLHTFEDLTGNERIALPQPGSIQHILLALAADRHWGDPTRFDARLLSLSHPDGMTALLAGRDLDAHFTTPPFLFEELAASDAHLLLGGREAFGRRFTFVVSVAAPRGIGTDDGNGAAVDRYRRVLVGAVADLSRLQEALREGERPPLLNRLAAHYGLETEALAAQLVRDEVVFTTEVFGLQRFEEAMREFGYVQ